MYCYMGGKDGPCPNLAKARGLCATHYHQAWRNDTLPRKKPKKEAFVREQVMLSKVSSSKLRKLSRVTGRSVSEILRDAVEALLAEPGAA